MKESEKESSRFSSYTFGEARTGGGQLISFTRPLDADEKKIKEFLSLNIRDIDIPATNHVNILHGGYGQHTRYNITQHKYTGGGHLGCGGYFEILEIKNPPNGRWGIVINEYNTNDGGIFSEWKTINDACLAFRKSYKIRSSEKKLSQLPGFKRLVICGDLVPWFYAVGNQTLIGDYAFPEGLQDDPTYRTGQQFVVFDQDGIPKIKTCLGTRLVVDKSDYGCKKEHRYRLVYWNDGSVFDESRNHKNLPRPLEENEMWITEAMRQFKQLLAGRSTEFSINFSNGNKFVGKIKRVNPRASCAEGNYNLIVKIKGEKKVRAGWVNFKPTQHAPNIIQYINQSFAKKSLEVEYIEVKKRQTKIGGKKWVGAFFTGSD